MREEVQSEDTINEALELDMRIPIDIQWAWDYDSEQAVIISAKISESAFITSRDVYARAKPGTLSAIDSKIRKIVHDRGRHTIARAVKRGDRDARIRMGKLPPKNWFEVQSIAQRIFPKVPYDRIRDYAERSGALLEPGLDGRASVVIAATHDHPSAADLIDRLLKDPMSGKFTVEQAGRRTILVWAD